MEAGTQSALLILWALFWMLILSLMMVHPMFRAARVQIRRSLRLNLNHWNTVRQRLRVRLLRLRGHFRLRVGKTLLWLARRLESGGPASFWVRLLLRLPWRLLSMYLIFHLLFRQTLTWLEVLAYLALMETIDALHNAWKRRKLRLQQRTHSSDSPLKSAREQSAKPWTEGRS